MSPKIRFAITVARQVLAIVDLVIFPVQRRPRPRRGSSRVLVFARFIGLFFSVLSIVQAWRDLKRAEREPERKAAVKLPHNWLRGRTRGKRRKRQ